jgi:hypothetical protein
MCQDWLQEMDELRDQIVGHGQSEEFHQQLPRAQKPE